MKQGRLCAVLVLAMTAVLLAPAAADVISGNDIHKFFDKYDYKYTVKDDFNWWVLPYKGSVCGDFNVDVKYGRDYTYVMAYLFDVPKDCGRFFYWDLCRRNFELNQVKLSIDGDNRLWISYEIPNRILDWNELCSDIDTIACWYEDNYNGLKVAMNKWWDYGREAEFRPTYTRPSSYSSIDAEARAHIEATSPGWEEPTNARFPDYSRNPVSDDVVSAHISETSPPREFIRSDYRPPVNRSTSNAITRPNRPKIAKVEKMPSLTPVNQGNAIAKAEMSDEQVAGVKQRFVKPRKTSYSPSAHNYAARRDANRSFAKTAEAYRAPEHQVAPYAPASKRAWIERRAGSETNMTRSDRVAGWSERTNYIHGRNMIDRSRSKILQVYSYEDKLIIH